jgi:hypothetical protein
MSDGVCTNNRVQGEHRGVWGTIGNWIELLQDKEHGKTARTIAITMCVVGAIAAISSAATIQRYFAGGAAPRPLPRKRPKRIARRSNGSVILPRTRSLSRAH